MMSPVRQLYLESMGYEGIFAAVKDYIQPIIMALAIAMLTRQIVQTSLSDVQLTSLAIAPVYLLLYVLSAIASRHAHGFASRFRSEDGAARALWWATAGVFVIIAMFAFVEMLPVVIAGFVMLNVLQNFWRPLLVTRLDERAGELQGATLLSIESQMRRLTTMIAAPIIGWLIDWVARTGFGGQFWPIGAVGGLVALLFALRRQTPMKKIL